MAKLDQAKLWFWSLLVLSFVCFIFGILNQENGEIFNFHLFDFLGTCATLVVGYSIALYAQRAATSSSRLYDLISQKMTIAEGAIKSAHKSSLDYLNNRHKELRQIMQNDLKRASVAVREMQETFAYHNVDELSKSASDMRATLKRLRDLLDADNTIGNALAPETVTQVGMAYEWLLNSVAGIRTKCIKI